MNKQRRKEIKAKVLSALKKTNSLDLPVNIKEIVKSYSNCRLIPYSRLMKDMNLDIKNVIEFTGSDDACTDYYASNDKYIIYYNDVSESLLFSKRYRWNIAHELGHVVLQHHKKNNKTRLFRNTLSSKEYKEFEEEADYFASYILVPYAALNYLKISNKYGIIRYCKISNKAASYRYNDYCIWKKSKHDKYDTLIYKAFFKVIDKKYKCLFHKCAICGFGYSNESYLYCPICGSDNIKPACMEECKMIYNDGTKTDENKRAIKCPRCENEEIGGNEKYCKICGSPIINECADMEIQDGFTDFHTEKSCGKVLDSNARYCPYCGHESTYFQNEILKPWEEAKKIIESQEQGIFNEVAATVSNDESQDEPDNSNNGDFVEISDDEDLPF